MLHVNCSGFDFHTALQAAVAQGLVNRGDDGPRVYLSDLAEGLSNGQLDGAGYPGTKFIEWKVGHGDGPWYAGVPPCRNCAGLRARWLATFSAAANATPTPLTFDGLLRLALPRLRGRVLVSAAEPHALLPALTHAGVDALLPITTAADPLPRLPLALDLRGKFADETAATAYVARPSLLNRTNATAFAVQAPTCLPYLADTIVAYRLAAFWMDDMCANATQRREMLAFVNSSHFASAKGLTYLGWFNRTHNPNPEVLAECEPRHRLLTLASDQSDNLSFLARLPAHIGAQPPPWGGGPSRLYDPKRSYVALVFSDGDNIAEDVATLRPMLEQRVAAALALGGDARLTPVSWTVSNRWLRWGPSVLAWMFAAGRATGSDSFLMGPSGYAYTFPGNMSAETDKDWFAAATVGAAERLGMSGYVHWDVDQFLDPATTARTAAILRRYDGTAVRGAFMLGSDPLPPAGATPTWVGDVAAFKPCVQWGGANASAVAAAIVAVPRGELSYAYLTLGYDTSVVDEVARLVAAAPHVELVGYRELIEVAAQRRSRAS